MASTATEGRPATLAEYEALGEDTRAEFIDGRIVMTPFPSLLHQLATVEMANLLTSALGSEFLVVPGWGWRPGADEFGPDVMVVRREDVTTDVRFTGTPVLCVEIVSSNRANDYLVKAIKYAEAGLDQYWILDPEDGALSVLIREGQRYLPRQRIVRTSPKQTVDVAGHPVEVDLTVLLAQV